MRANKGSYDKAVKTLKATRATLHSTIEKVPEWTKIAQTIDAEQISASRISMIASNLHVQLCDDEGGPRAEDPNVQNMCHGCAPADANDGLSTVLARRRVRFAFSRRIR